MVVEPPCLSATMPKWEDYLAAVKTAPDNALFEEPAPNLSPSVRTSARSADFEYNSELGVSDGLYFNSTCVPGGCALNSPSR